MPGTTGSGKSSGSTQGTRRSGSGRRVAGSPWAPFEDAAGQVIRTFGARNAMAGVRAVDTSGDVIEIIGKAFRSVGTILLDEIDWDPRIAHYFTEMGTALIREAQPAREMAAAVRRHEAERIHNVEEGGARRRKWDIGEHD